MRLEPVRTLCVLGAFTGLLLMLFPPGPTGAAGKRAVAVCCLLEALRLLWVLVQGGMGRL